MAFFFLLVYLTLSYTRPFELYPELAGYRPMLVAGIVALVATVVSAFLRRTQSFRAMQIPLMAAFVVWVAFSLVAQGWFGGAVQAFERIGISAAMFFLVIFNVDSFRRLRIVAILLTLLSLFIVFEGVWAVRTGWNEERFVLTQQIDTAGNVERDELEGGAEPDLQYEKRIRSLGALNDPNDLAQALIVVMPFLALAWHQGRRFRNLCLVVVPASVLLYGIYLTRSRGGFVALSVMVLFALLPRLGRIRALLLTGVLALSLLALDFTGARGLTLDESALGRVESWSEGLLMLRSSPVWGIGYQNFVDYSDKAAHNSFINCAAELGLVGYFLWLGLIVLTVSELIKLRKTEARDEQTASCKRWAHASELALLTFLTAAWFLSRTYSETLLLLLALAVATVNIARKAEMFPEPVSFRKWGPRTGAFACLTLGAVWTLVKIARL